MARNISVQDLPKIRTSLKIYQILAWITGLFLLLLVVEMVLKYVFGLEFASGLDGEFVSLIPSALMDTSGLTNISLIIQITHGYIYITYLISAFVLVNLMRWPITKFLLLAAGGVVPLLSFFVEHSVSKQVRSEVAATESASDPAKAEGEQ